MSAWAQMVADAAKYTPAGRPLFGASGAFAESPQEHWIGKVTAMLAGWRAVFQEGLALEGAILACGVAQHETHCGDSWAGEYNWGAVQRRVPTLAEQTVLADAHIQPQPSNVTAARAALADAVAKHKVAADPSGALHVDSSPGRGWYWVFFWKFDSDAHGAAFFANVIAGKYRPKCRAVIENAGAIILPEGQTEGLLLAQEMYTTHYFEGHYVPTETVKLPDGTTRTGAQQNVVDYGTSVDACVRDITSALGEWVPDDANLKMYADTAKFDEFLTAATDRDPLPVPES